MVWYEELFASEAPARLGKYEESEASRKEVAFVLRSMEIGAESEILDLCCGQGRHLLEFRRRGFSAVGADLSSLNYA